MKIEFFPATKEIEGVFDSPVPAALMLPEWYKKQSGYVGKQKQVLDDGNYNHTIKHCMPALDAMTAGYIIKIPQDIEVVRAGENKDCNIRWPSDIFKQVSSHSLEQISELPVDQNMWDTTAWKWHNPWTIKTPPGYSCLFIQPMWHEDLPFRCFSGVVDTDKYNFQPINFPFLFKKGFEGKIHMGTPMIQVIPFKREEWIAKTKKKSNFNPKIWERSKRRFGHRYKKDYRQEKSFK